MKFFFEVLFLFVTYLFHQINSQKQVNYISMSIDEFANEINKKKFDKSKYDSLILSLKNVLSDFYVYINLTNSSKFYNEPIDLIKELSLINTSNIENFLDFLNIIGKIFSLSKDNHLNTYYLNFILYNYLIPIEFNVGTNKTENYLYYNVSKNQKIIEVFNESLIQLFKEKEGMKILEINKEDPFTYVQNFILLYFKDEHAQFTFNLHTIQRGIFYTFNPEKFKNIEIKFIDNTTIKYDYKIIYAQIQTNDYKLFFEKEINNYLQNSMIPPNLIEIEEKFNLINNINNVNNGLTWDINHNNLLKFKVDNENKVNVIYQNSFLFLNLSTIEVFGQIMEEMSKNDYPIIIIESLNSGGLINYTTIFQKILNFNSSKTKPITSFRKNKNISTIIDPFMSLYNIKTCEKENLSSSEINIDDLGDGIKIYRSDLFLLINSNTSIEEPLKKYKYKERKPTDIIIFTDGYSYSATSFFIKDIQESGNGIIVGYNGIPTKEKKNEKFNASQSPSIVLLGIYTQIKDNKDIENLFNAGFFLSIPIGASYNDSYQSSLKIPREYTVEKIDERSNIYGKYNDDRYLEFVNEGKRIFKKYLNECNPDNLNLLLKNDKCSFKNDKFAHGGFQCNNEGKWSQICKPYYCDYKYYFDYYEKKCKFDTCFSKNNNDNLIIYIIIIVSSVLLIVLFIFLMIKKCKKKVEDAESIQQTSQLIPN